MKRFRIVVSWIAALSVMGLIFYLSHQEAAQSGELSEGFIARIYRIYLRFTGIPCSTAEFDHTVASLEFVVRKLAHFSIYAILGFLMSNAFYQQGIAKHKMFALIASVLYAASDEFHQLFIKGRSCEVRDVLIDSAGSLTGIMFFWLFIIVWRKLWILKKH